MSRCRFNTLPQFGLFCCCCSVAVLGLPCSVRAPLLIPVTHGLSCLMAGGILFPHQGSNPRPLHWKLNFSSLDHRGSPWVFTFEFSVCFCMCSRHCLRPTHEPLAFLPSLPSAPPPACSCGSCSSFWELLLAAGMWFAHAAEGSLPGMCFLQ